MWKIFSLCLIVFLFWLLGVVLQKKNSVMDSRQTPINFASQKNLSTNSLQITQMRKRSYPGSIPVIEKDLGEKNDYHQYIASYLSDNLKIYGLLTVPIGKKPDAGWPVIIFNHGYISPEQYKTTERYVAYVDAFAKNGYIVFKSDYRGNGSSEGQPEGAYYSPAYTVDVLNAVGSIKKLQDPKSGDNEKFVNTDKIGMWGHSMGGNITLRNLVVDGADIRAAVIWGGVVGSYYDLANNWHRKTPFRPSERERFRSNYRQNLIGTYGSPDSASEFWQSVDPTFYLSDITTPIQLHTGGDDEVVPVGFSIALRDRLETLGKVAEYYNYPGGDHNISSPNFNLAMGRSLKFFDRHLK